MREQSWVAGPAILMLVLAACSSDGTSDSPEAGDAEPADEQTEPAEDAPDPVELPQAENSPKEDVPSALDDMNNPEFPEPLLDTADIMSGGPPPDGIPAIDEPKFEKVEDVNWLEDTEAVLAVEINGDARAYPFRVMMWHEIVNDTVGDVPIAATYCPLCNSGVAFDRRVGDRVLDFGTSGRLHASNLVMYDRQTESLWPQLTGEAAVGVMTGTQLDFIPISPVGWADFREAHPDGWVLSRDTGHSRDYGANPYAGLDTDPNRDPAFGSTEDDDRLPPMERVIGVHGQDESVTIVRSDLAEAGVLTETLDGEPLVAFHADGQASALEAGSVSGGSDIGTVAVFDPTVEGEELTFSKDGDMFTDEQTGSTWDIFGRAVDGPLEGERLDERPFIDTFWLTWLPADPDTRIIGG
ncbi:MAG TPA: DUF3179 domain-containing (seleno)protein [Jiangellaceae bacterium]